MPQTPFRPRGRFAQQAPAIIQPAPDLIQPPKLILPPALQARYSKQPAPPEEQEFIPSEQQQGYFDWLQIGKGNALLIAVAGAGKTTTLIQGFKHMSGKIFCGAYNASAAEDIKTKALKAAVTRPGLGILTSHGAGNFHCKKMWPQVQVSDRKSKDMLERFIDRNPAEKQAKDYVAFIGKMVSFGKQFLIGCRGKPGIDSMGVWLKLAEHFGTDQDIPEDLALEQAITWAMEVYKLHIEECPKRIDFDDMIFAPIYHNMRFFQNDWVVIDECQDINPARRELARRMLKAGGRAVFVGDPRQAIYGFTGAGGDSIARIKEEFNCTELPLTVTYRCPKAVVSYVQQWVSHIQAHPDAPEGVVRNVNYAPEQPCPECEGEGHHMIQGEFPVPCRTCAGRKRIPAKPWFRQDEPKVGDVVLCRNTRPLIQTAYAMIKDGLPCKVEGRDIGNGLISLARTWKISTLEKLEERLAKHLDHEVAKARKQQSEKKEQEITDKVETLRIFIARCKEKGKHRIDDLVAEIESLFADDTKDVVKLCTGHKSKGREWSRVYWLQLPPATRFMKEWEEAEELNIKYVIGTRAKEELILVPPTLTK